MEAVYPDSINEVVEIDPLVTQVAHDELWLPLDTSIKTINQDARLFLIQRDTIEKYDVVIGDVVNGIAVPYHLTTLEFNRLVKANMEEDGIYLLNIIANSDNIRKYIASMIYTLEHAFDNIYFFYKPETWGLPYLDTYIIAATDRYIDLNAYNDFHGGPPTQVGVPIDETALQQFLAEEEPILLTDDHAPTDILLAPAHVYSGGRN